MFHEKPKMSTARPLRGGCHCGRNRYIIKCPDLSIAQLQRPQVLFNDRQSHLPSFGGSLLSAFLRVPLENFFSATIPFHADETHSLISKVCPSSAHEQRRFCGFCGTPLSYWSEEPRSEADYIQLTLGSLFPEDLADLEDLGLLPDSGSDSSDAEGGADDDGAEQQKQRQEQDTPMAEHDAEEEEMVVTTKRRQTVGGVSWFDTLMEGSRLGGRVRVAKGRRTNRSGSVRVEWEVVEWNDDGGEDEAAAEAARNGKRKLADREGAGPAGGAMEGVRRHV
ncbi:hypothetical protein B0T18DRAFT_394605 [Schizothecium vesticola]|uniref:CENP-V/GFA domain-containing protein n=1 Tax=Schizothecium vesticola TaxID=314040 RepID=A0AA40EEA8_9PEZI|nr:hypothetical protein B0T18DRAFT_394605 [Schizothecium vesticola]